MDDQLKSNLTSSKHWSRLVYMIIFAVCLQVASVVMWVLVGLQFLFALITGKDNLNLRRFGDSLSEFIYQALQFLTYVSDDKPFPFSDWPVSDVVEEVVVPVDDGELDEESESDTVARANDVKANESVQENDGGETGKDEVEVEKNETVDPKL